MMHACGWRRVGGRALALWALWLAAGAVTGWSGGDGVGALSVSAAEAHDAPKRGTVSRVSQRGVQRLTTEQVRRAVSNYLQGRLDGRISEIDVEVLDPTEPVIIPAGRVRLDVATSSSLDQSGRRRFQVVPVVDGHPGESIDVVADVVLYADVVVPARMLKPEDVIEAEDLSTMRVKIPSLPHQLATQVSDAVGKSPGRVLQAQQPIRVASLVKPLTVHKGDRVTIEARRGGLAIQAVGTTKTAGQLGGFVTVTNADSGKDIRAKVVGPGLVRVEF